MNFQLLLATTNPSKTRELANSLADFDFEIRTLADFPKLKMPPENGATFEENAKIKAEFCHEKTGLIALADDSGIFVEALPHELGVKTVRFGRGENASDREWLDYFLEKMRDKKNRRAKFVCVLALARANLETEFFRGEVEGEILREIDAPILPRIPLSSVFLANDATRVFAAMSENEKAKFSHRGRALKKLKTFLKNALK